MILWLILCGQNRRVRVSPSELDGFALSAETLLPSRIVAASIAATNAFRQNGDWHIIGECFERPAPDVQHPVFLIADTSNDTICFSPEPPEYEDLENYPDYEIDVMRELLALDTSNWQE